MDIINIEIPNKASYISTVRLTVASVANKMNFNCEEIEDLTVSVSEACNFIIKNKKASKFIAIKIISSEGNLEIHVRCDQKNRCENILSEEDYLGIMILEFLMDKVEMNENGICLFKNKVK